MPETLSFDWDDLTVGEVIDLEEIAGVAIGDIDKDGQPQGKVLLAMVYIAKRRENPDFTLDDAKATPVKSLATSKDTAERPTEPAGS